MQFEAEWGSMGRMKSLCGRKRLKSDFRGGSQCLDWGLFTQQNEYTDRIYIIGYSQKFRFEQLKYTLCFNP